MPISLTDLPAAEMRSLVDQAELARLFADAMQLNGAGAMSGDVFSALGRLGLRFVTVDDGDPGENATARLNSLTETQPCSCDCVWMRFKDAEGPGVGWWHRDDDHHFTRKCPDNGRKPKG